MSEESSQFSGEVGTDGLLSERISIVLVNTSHPGNIGSTARAMKTMGLRRLVLVAPQEFPSSKADALASGADDLFSSVRVVSSLEEAVANCHFVVGTSARVRGVSLPLVEPGSAAEKVIQHAGEGSVAVVFGREDRGLTNDELQQCHLQVHIPTDAEFSSLNLAAAVQVICYELRSVWLAASEAMPVQAPKEHPLASQQDMERYYQHLYRTLVRIGFLDHSSHRKIMAKLRRLYARTHPDLGELAILRGILSETERTLDGIK